MNRIIILMMFNIFGITGVIFPQGIYNDFVPTENIYLNNFSTLTTDPLLKQGISEEVNVDTKNGIYYYYNKHSKSLFSKFIEIEINESKDFEIEMRLKVNGVYGALYWRDNLKIDKWNYFALNATYSNVSNYKTEIGEYSYGNYNVLLPWNETKINKTNFTTLTIRIINGIQYFYVNRKFIFSQSQDKNPFRYIGFLCYPKVNLEIDYLRISYLENLLKVSDLRAEGDNIKDNKLPISDVDVNIPKTNFQNSHTYVLVIGNEDYKSKQKGLTSEQNVEFAENDASVFAKYCENTLGVPKRQIKLLHNATFAEIHQGLSWIKNLSKLEDGNAHLIFYYSGHGLPNEKTKEAYIIPVDVAGTNIEYAVKLNDVYNILTEYPSKRVTVFLDACFSGGARNQGLIAMKGVRIKPKENIIYGNLVSFSSSTGNESSAVYREKNHGYFTYFLLKKIKEANGNVDYKTLSDYIYQRVSKEAALEGIIQTPQINVSPQIEETWENWKLK